jgi:asparaginyl-tRNA synthetase
MSEFYAETETEAMAREAAEAVASTTCDACAPDVATVSVTRVERLADLSPESVGTYVKLSGWIYSTRAQGGGTLVFVDLGDGATVTPIRCVAHLPTDVEAGCGVYPSRDLEYGKLKIIDPIPSSDQDSYEHLTFDEMCQTSCLSIGCSVMIYGYIAEPPAGTTQTFEVKMLSLFVIGGVADPGKYPIQKSILKKPVSLRPHYHDRFRAQLIQVYMMLRAEALFAVHDFFHREKVPCLDPSIMTSSDCEGAGEVFKVSPQFFSSGAIAEMDGRDSSACDPWHEVGLTVSSQLPLEAIAMGTGSVYTCQKSFRAEKSDTIKHLAEFLHVEFERYFITLDGLLAFTEHFVKFLIRATLKSGAVQYDFLESKLAPPEHHGHRQFLESLLEKPFVRIKHADAIDMMQEDLRDKVKVIGASGKEVRLKFKVYPRQGEDLGSEHEKYLVEKFGTFVFVTHWPSAIKSFYMKQVGDGTCESFDLLAPLVGELFGGSMREWRYDVLVDEMIRRDMERTETPIAGTDEVDIDFGPLQWFVDVRKDGTAPHGGWGMGFDRLVMFLAGAPSVRDVVPYPVYYGHCPY